MRVFVVGAGAVASVLVKKLSEDKEISAVSCGTIDLKRAKEFIDTADPKVSLIFLDAFDSNELVKAINGFDLVINASLPELNTKIMEAALKVGAHYQDCASLLADWKTPEQLSFDKDFKKAGLVGLFGASAAPGLSNLLAREAFDSFDSVEWIKFKLFEEQNSTVPVFSWSPEHTANELAAKPLFFKEGKFVFAKPFSDNESYSFPSPIGVKKTVNLFGDEVSTIPIFLNVRNVDFKSGGSDIDYAMGLYSEVTASGKVSDSIGDNEENINLFVKNTVPVPSPKELQQMIKDEIVKNAVFAISVEAIGIKDGKKISKTLSVVFPNIHKITQLHPGATYISYPSGICAYAFAKLVTKLSNKGVCPPEALGASERKFVFDILAKNGIVPIYALA